MRRTRYPLKSEEKMERQEKNTNLYMDENNDKSTPESQVTKEERRAEERRRKKSDGYMYISTVGWICRRERCRREDDDNII